ncbi:MAG TPA: hypothetical protein VN112_22825 [Ensifer sp.]|nr:hypothetical protein [Ensifer sp.]
MTTQRSLPTVIGPTENALRALLTKILSSTPIKTYSAWVILNAVANAGPSSPNWKHSVADALKVSNSDVDTSLGELRDSGLLTDDGTQTPLGITELAKARSAVASATAQLVEGISEGDQQMARAVLERVRSRAETMLQLQH